MKASEIRKLSAKELDAKLLELKDELFKLRFQQAVNQLNTYGKKPQKNSRWHCDQR